MYCRSCCLPIRVLRHIQESLPDEVVKTTACSVIGSHLDYCNTVLSGMSKSNFTKLQRVRNMLARINLCRRKLQNITLALKEFYWLWFSIMSRSKLHFWYTSSTCAGLRTCSLSSIVDKKLYGYWHLVVLDI